MSGYKCIKATLYQNNSLPKLLRYGVPQRSCAGPVIFTMYIAALNKVVQEYPADLYGYADDHKLAFKIQAGNLQHETSVLQQLGNCVKDVIEWMNRFKLKINNSKTEVIIYGTKQQLSKINISSVDIGGCQIRCVDHVRDLGVHMTSTLNFEDHIRKKCQTAHVQLRNLKDIRKYISQRSAEILVHGLVHSHLDFCNGLFVDIPNYQIDRLQRVQNRAARIVTNASFDQNSKDILKSLHWLPVRARIMFKILVMVFRVIHKTAPVYLQQLFTRSQSRYKLRSTDEINLNIPRTRTRMAERSIAVTGPKWWNALSNHLKCIEKEDQFRCKLKTHLFNVFFD